jgi:hypothetical protein
MGEEKPFLPWIGCSEAEAHPGEATARRLLCARPSVGAPLWSHLWSLPWCRIQATANQGHSQRAASKPWEQGAMLWGSKRLCRCAQGE